MVSIEILKRDSPSDKITQPNQYQLCTILTLEQSTIHIYIYIYIYIYICINNSKLNGKVSAMNARLQVGAGGVAAPAGGTPRAGLYAPGHPRQLAPRDAARADPTERRGDPRQPRGGWGGWEGGRLGEVGAGGEVGRGGGEVGETAEVKGMGRLGGGWGEVGRLGNLQACGAGKG